MKKRPIPKKFFLLLEVTLACALAALCLVPLIKPHFAIRQARLIELEKMIFERESYNAFLEVKTSLYKHQIPFETLCKGVSSFLKEIEIKRGRGFARHFEISYELQKKKLYTHSKTHFRYLLLDCTIRFASHGKELSTHTFPLFIEAKRASLT